MKLALGTVQLGIPYGVANQSGMPDDVEAAAILRAAAECGYEWLDTASAYGQSESVLGRLLPSVWQDDAPGIATKIVLKNDVPPAQQLAESLKRLARPHVEALLLHNEADVDHPRMGEFAGLTSGGLAKRVGVSCYNPRIALRGMELGLQCLQVPCNLFDTGSIDAGVFRNARERGVLVFVRSIFLQGLFFLTPDHPRAQRIPGAAEALRFLHDFCQRHAIEPARLALAFGAGLDDAVIVLGADKSAQVRANAQLARDARHHREIVDRWLHERPNIASTVTSPGLWPAN